uniref:Uncharacterized protein n=1 Tax=Steinernema glaseri TaxID=37863 RepID=A0A1I7ZA68_9BILA
MFVFFLVAFFTQCLGSPDALKAACARNPGLAFCRSSTAIEPFPELMREEREQNYDRSVKRDYIGPSGPCDPCEPFPAANQGPFIPPPPPPFPSASASNAPAFGSPFFHPQPQNPDRNSPAAQSNPFGFGSPTLGLGDLPIPQGSKDSLGQLVGSKLPNPLGSGNPLGKGSPQIPNPLGGGLPIPSSPFGSGGPNLPDFIGGGSGGPQIPPNPLGIGAPQIPVGAKGSGASDGPTSFVFGAPPPGDVGPFGPFQAPPGGKVPPPRDSLQKPAPSSSQAASVAPVKAPPPNSPELLSLCQKFESIVKQHCHGPQTEPFYAPKCAGYFKDCGEFMTEQNPLAMAKQGPPPAAGAKQGPPPPATGAKQGAPPQKMPMAPKDFSSGVDMNYGSASVKGIPFYPINEEGTVEAARTGRVGYGSWGGGYSDQVGVRDYWSQHAEYGANVKEGKFGYQNGWSVPLVQSLGVEGGGGTAVSVPLKKEDIGKKPIEVDTGYGVGGYYKQNDHLGVDWKRGDISKNFGVGVPFAGVGLNTGLGVHFPSVDTFLSKLTP